MDKHADTHCFAANFRPIPFTSEDYNVSQFLREYAGQMNLYIDKGVNALELDSGVVVILDFGQGLRSGNRMEKSLINPNQFRKFGTKIYNEPTNPHRKLGIETSEDLFILMKMGG